MNKHSSVQTLLMLYTLAFYSRFLKLAWNPTTDQNRGGEICLQSSSRVSLLKFLLCLKCWLNKLALCSGTCVATMPIILSPQNQEARTESADHKTLGVYKFVSDWEQ